MFAFEKQTKNYILDYGIPGLWFGEKCDLLICGEISKPKL